MFPISQFRLLAINWLSCTLIKCIVSFCLVLLGLHNLPNLRKETFLFYL